MLRRLAVFLRRGLFVVGVVLLLWWPVSYFIYVRLETPGMFFAGSAYGLAGVEMVLDKRQGHAPFSIGASRVAGGNPWSPHLSQWHPNFEHDAWPEPGRYIAYVYIPLWLLAAACLACPVTSFVLARRRGGRGRGFAVEAASASPLPPGEGGPKWSEAQRRDG